MKKLVLLLAMVFTLAVAGLCQAADGNDLNKQQKACESFLGALELREVPVTEAVVTSGFAVGLKNNMADGKYAELLKNIRTQLGNLQEYKFRAFERFDKGDIITYQAKFSKKQLVVVRFEAGPDNKLVNIGLTPVEPAKK